MLLYYQDIWTKCLNQMKFYMWYLDLMDVQIKYDYTHGDYSMLLCNQAIWTKFSIWLLDLIIDELSFAALTTVKNVYENDYVIESL